MNHHPCAGFAVLLFILAGCTESNPTVALADLETEVAELMETQRVAWNRGDLVDFVSYYDSSMTFCGSDGVIRGTAGMLERYQKSYPTAKERGVLTFKVTDVRQLGGDHALVLGEYALAREAPAHGYFSLVVQRTSAGMRILHDHTSAAKD